MTDTPSRKRLVEQLGEFQKELFEKEGLKFEVEWLEHALRKRTRLLDERTKELVCITQTLKALREPESPFDERMQRIAELLPRAWQYPENAYALLRVADKAYKTANYAETPWSQKRDVIAFGKRQGFVQVGYLCDKSEADEGPFLREERMLLDIISEYIGMYLERGDIPLSPRDY